MNSNWRQRMHGVKTSTEHVKKVLKKSSQTGFGYLLESISHRIVWGLVLVLFIILTTYQIVQQLERFMEHPIATNTEIAFPDTLPFPAVLICNTNQNRFTFLAENLYKFYDEYDALVKEDYQNGHNKTKEKFATRHDYFLHKSGEQSSRIFMDAAAHIKENFIIGCRWPDGSACSSANFTRVRTDHGVCYAANADPARVHHVQVGGSGEALWLALNVESYEYTERIIARSANKLHESPGIKIMVYSQDRVPLVSKQAFSLSAGYSYDISLQMRERHQLEFGKFICHKQLSSKYYGNITDSLGACVMTNMFANVTRECNCLPYNIVDDITSAEHYTCADRWIHDMHAANEGCAVPCDSTEYEPTVYMGTLPDNLMDRRLFSLSSVPPAHALDKYSYARLNRLDSHFADLNSERINMTTPPLVDIDRNLVQLGNDAHHRMMARRYHALEARYHYLDELRLPLKKLMDALRLANDRMEAQGYRARAAEYVTLSDRINASLPCFGEVQRKHLPYFPLPIDTAALSEDDINEDLPVTRFIRTLQSNMTRRAYIRLKRDVFDMLQKLSAPFHEFEAHRLSSDFDEYIRLFKMLDEYENGTLSRHHWALEMHDERFSQFFKNRMAEELQSLTVADGKALHKSLLASESFMNKLNASMTNRTIVALTGWLLYGNMTEKHQTQAELAIRALVQCRFQHTPDHDGNVPLGHNHYTVILAGWTAQAESLVAAIGSAYAALLKNQMVYERAYTDRQRFISENILTTTIFLKDLTKEVNTQELTYSAWALLCDIGGTLGLFLGASVVTVIELFWLCCCVRFMNDHADEDEV